LRLSRLERLLEQAVPRIPGPRRDLEQYTTPAGLALRLAMTVSTRWGLEGVIADLGAGTCRLSAALALLGAENVVAVEADARLAPLCRAGLERLGLGHAVSTVVAVVSRRGGPLAEADVIVMNPPFGVHRRGADREFLEYAFSLGPARVYAILKSGNQEFHSRLAERHGYRARLLYREEFPLPAEMERHRSRIRRVVVDVYEFEKLR